MIATAAAGQTGFFESEDPLLAATLPIDIQSAEDSDLVTWLQKLGLDDAGDLTALRQRLRDYYGLPTPYEEPEADPSRAITVQSARSARYRTDERGHITVELAGEVSVAARERDSGVTHVIRADRITYHSKRHSLTAAGSVVYTVLNAGSTEVFRGKSLSVDTERWEGVFYAGYSRIAQPVEGGDSFFTYAGEAITRREDDTVVMEKATITSSENPDDPNYRVEAERLWVLAPEEWALRNAFLHVGEVPILYLPYFIRPGGRLLFNPSIGQRRREGTYLQTTTYLIGRKPTIPTSLSFLPGGEASAEYTSDSSGLFLWPTRGAAVEPETELEGEDMLSLMVDLYTRLGIFGGLQGQFGDISLFAGLGASRSLIEDPRLGGRYTPYLRGAGGELVSHWDSSTILGAAIPLRYGLDLEIDRRGERGGLQGRFELFSDPSFATDFLSRTDDLSTGGLLGWPQGPLASTPARNRLEWKLGGDLALHSLIDSPALATLKLPTIDARWSWLSRKEEEQFGTATALERLQAVSPTRWFYYPDKLTLPAVAAVAEGTLYQLPDEGGVFNASVGYSIRPVATVDHLFDSEEATVRDQVSLDTRYSRIGTRVTGQLEYSASAFDRLIGLDGVLAESAAFQLHVAKSDGIEESLSEQLVLSDRKRTRSNLRLNNTLTLRPLLFEPSLADTSLSYGLGLALYDVRFDPATGVPLENFLRWDREGVLSHRLVSKIRFAGGDLSARLDAGFDLPPRLLTVDGSFEAAAGPLGVTLRGGVAKREDGPRAGQLNLTPIDGRGVLRMGEDASLVQSFHLDDEQRLKSLRTKASAYGVSGALHAALREPLDPFGMPVSLTDDPSLRATDLILDYSIDTETLSYWKNRVKLQVGLHTRLAVDPEAYIRDNSLTFDFRLGLSIHKFLDLSLLSSSVNRHLYRYLPVTAKRAGENSVNPIVDLARSFNFLNREDRMASAFKLESMRVEALHRLGDWNLSLTYQGRSERHEECPEMEQAGPCIAWTPAFSVEVRWIPIPELYGTITVDRWGIDIQDR